MVNEINSQEVNISIAFASTHRNFHIHFSHYAALYIHATVL